MSDVEKLWELQSLLTQLNDREKRMATKPDSFAVVDREYAAANEEIERLQQQIEALAKERRRVEGELSDQQEQLKKYQGQLMLVKNQQQYAAAWKEIDASRKHVKDLEESVLKSMTDSDALQASLDEKRGSFEGLKARYDEAHAEWQHSLGDLREESAKLRERADAVEAAIPPRLRNEFHKIYKQRQQIAVAAANSETCSACRTRIRPALAQQLKRGEFAYCEGCHRMLYWENPSS
ncbi:MAG: C4-type zinc ribbon domain-containing protein [Thermoanaerobaculia bacterium]